MSDGTILTTFYSEVFTQSGHYIQRYFSVDQMNQYLKHAYVDTLFLILGLLTATTLGKERQLLHTRSRISELLLSHLALGLSIVSCPDIVSWLDTLLILSPLQCNKQTHESHFTLSCMGYQLAHASEYVSFIKQALAAESNPCFCVNIKQLISS